MLFLCVYLSATCLRSKTMHLRLIIVSFENRRLPFRKIKVVSVTYIRYTSLVVYINEIQGTSLRM